MLFVCAVESLIVVSCISTTSDWDMLGSLNLQQYVDYAQCKAELLASTQTLVNGGIFIVATCQI